MRTFLHTGYGNYVATAKVVAVHKFDSLPIKRLVNEARGAGQLMDHTQGRKTRSVVSLQDGYVALSILDSDTLVNRADG